MKILRAWSTIILILAAVVFQTGCIEPLLDQACNQYGYNATVRDRELNYGATRYNQGAPLDTIIAEIRARLTDQLTQCRTGEARSSIVRHLTVDRTQMPNVAGAVYIDDHWMLSSAANLAYYQYEDGRGPWASSAHIGMKTLRVPIGVDSSETVNAALALIHKARLAGYVYVWPVLYLKNDCCTQRPIPASLAVGVGNPPNETALFNNVTAYANNTLGALLDGSELPIIAVEVGNEADGGFWTGYDAGPYYGPPARLDRTKKVFQSARNGVNQAYANRGLARPFFMLHVMPDIGFSSQTNQKNLLDLLDSTSVNGPLFDVVAFSFYPNSRGPSAPNPIGAAQRLATLGAASGLPWLIAEGGFAQELARPVGSNVPGPGAWNFYTDLSLCPSLVGTTCSSISDMQGKILTATTSVLGASAGYRGFIYLAPQANVMSNSQGYTEPSADQYRMALWVDAYNVNHDTTSTAALTPAFLAFKPVAQALFTPQVESGDFVCDYVSACVVWFWGRNFQYNAAIDAIDPTTNKFVRYHVNQLHVDTPSVVEVTLSTADANRFIATGLQFKVVNPGVYLTDASSSAYFMQR